MMFRRSSRQTGSAHSILDYLRFLGTQILEGGALTGIEKLINIFKRGKIWKEFVENSILERATATSDLADQLGQLRQTVADLRQEMASRDKAAVEARRDMFALRLSHPDLQTECPILTDTQARLALTIRGDVAYVIEAPQPASTQVGLPFQGLAPAMVVKALVAGTIKDLQLITRLSGRDALRSMPLTMQLIRSFPHDAIAALESRCNTSQATDGHRQQSSLDMLKVISDDLPALDFYAHGIGSDASTALPIAPFDDPMRQPSMVAAEPRRHSAILLHNNYYHFNCLAAGLRSRGWDVVTVALESPDAPQQQFYHGQDISLYDSDPATMKRNTTDFFRTIPEKYGSLHFYGQYCPSFFPEHFGFGPASLSVPFDFLELRRHRTLIGYMPSGCLDGGLQSSIRSLSGGTCSRCVWEHNPAVCNEERSLHWNQTLAILCDWVGLEVDYATPERVSPKSVYGPVVTALDPDRWHPDLAPPDDMRVERAPDELLIYHAVGNYMTRRSAGRDIKGTGAVMAAVEQLKAEGLPVRLIFAHDIPSTKVRFLQVQADIIVDQLNYGRYGANAREALMLGKPTICRLSSAQAHPLAPSRAIEEAPLVHADETSIVDVLRALVLDAGRREAIGRHARAFAVAWHGQDACAERYEKVIDRLRAGLPPEVPDLYPSATGCGWLP